MFVIRVRTYRSDATMKMFGFTVRYLPFPHPMSSPIDPSGRSFRNFSTMGHGCRKDQLRFRKSCWIRYHSMFVFRTVSLAFIDRLSSAQGMLEVKGNFEAETIASNLNKRQA